MKTFFHCNWTNLIRVIVKLMETKGARFNVLKAFITHDHYKKSSKQFGLYQDV